MSDAPLPLLDLFNDLREAGLPLGTNDYLLLIEALRRGLGIEDQAALFRLCRLLWTKSYDEARVLERLFHRAVPMLHEAKGAAASASASPVAASSKTPTPKESPPSAASSAGDEPGSPRRRVGRQTEHALDVAIASVHNAPTDLPAPRWLSTPDEYLPVTGRQMKQSWRRLRRMERRGPRTEPDVAATIAQISRDGVFLGPTLVARRVNVASLLVMIDREGSMAPFQVLARRFIETARRDGRFSGVEAVYFHNVPVDYVDREGPVGDAVRLSELIARAPKGTTGVLVFSDAGAARGHSSRERIEKTREFLEKLRRGLRLLAWLNPVPRHRWLGTSAQAIRDLVPMFEVSRAGFDAALRILRGRRPHPRAALG